jgi:hypothetical protein
MKILHTIVRRTKKAIQVYKESLEKWQLDKVSHKEPLYPNAFDFRRLYLHPVKEAGENKEDTEGIMRNRFALRSYLQEFLDAQMTIFGNFK